MKHHLDKSIKIILKNAKRLCKDADCLDYDQPTTGWFLAIIAQEELAKAFLLTLVMNTVIPWSPHILRATRDHASKQLICVVMEYLNPEFEEFAERIKIPYNLRKPPSKVVDALNILRHEKIGRWESGCWVCPEEWKWDKEALAISNGKKDRLKQDALYVRLDSVGRACSEPTKLRKIDVRQELERASRFEHLVEGLSKGDYQGLDWGQVEQGFRLLFSEPSVP